MIFNSYKKQIARAKSSSVKAATATGVSKSRKKKLEQYAREDKMNLPKKRSFKKHVSKPHDGSVKLSIREQADLLYKNSK